MAALAAATAALLTSAEALRDDEVGTCAMNHSAACPLPTWAPTYNLSESSIMYQPWCINNGGEDCTGLLNVSLWWNNPARRDIGSVAEAHWGLLAIDDSESTHMWTSTTCAPLLFIISLAISGRFFHSFLIPRGCCCMLPLGSLTDGGATPGHPLTFKAQQAMLDNCNFVRMYSRWFSALSRCFVVLFDAVFV
jgi:hypothetical protein